MGKMKKKGGSSNKTSVKKKNKIRTKLTRQGKMKVQRHKKKTIEKSKPNPQIEPDVEDEEPEDNTDDMREMIEADDLIFLEKAASGNSYSMFRRNNYLESNPPVNIEGKKRKKKYNDSGLSIEKDYIQSLNDEEEDMEGKRTRYLLPIKTDDGLVRRAVTEKIKPELQKGSRKKQKTEGIGKEEVKEEEDEYKIELSERNTTLQPVTMADMLAWREDALTKYKFKIGLLCSNLLEDPENNVLNIKKLLDIYDEWYPELQVTLKKLVIVSLTEVFKDILPSYQIKHQDNPDVKLKKGTRRLQDSEKRLLKGYRGYLMKLEKLASKLYRKKGDHRKRTPGELSLGELSIKCFCDIVVIHPYFNYSKNIIQVLIPYLDNPRGSVRTKVSETFKTMFNNDKRGEITLHIVRRINDFIKRKRHSVKADMVLVLETLKLSSIKLDDIKEEEEKKKAILAKKKRLINLSRKEKKRLKKLEEVEKELLETQGEENKKSREKTLTEVTKMVFNIYFRILKNAPSSGLLSATLQGIAKFATCINIEFYLDLVTVLDGLMKSGCLGLRERLNCIFTVFTILSGQGEALNIDPNYFYRHLYNAQLEVRTGGSRDDCNLLFHCLDRVLIGRRKKLTFQRMLGFMKRSATMALHQQHHATLSCLYLIKQILQLQRSTEILLETDSSIGQGIYLPDLEDPEHCNASTASLYELIPLQMHYHPTVRLLAEHIAHGVPASGKGSLPPDLAKLHWMDALRDYDSSDIAFNPSIPKDPQVQKSKTSRTFQLENIVREKYISEFNISLTELSLKTKVG